MKHKRLILLFSLLALVLAVLGGWDKYAAAASPSPNAVLQVKLSGVSDFSGTTVTATRATKLTIPGSVNTYTLKCGSTSNGYICTANIYLDPTDLGDSSEPTAKDGCNQGYVSSSVNSFLVTASGSNTGTVKVNGNCAAYEGASLRQIPQVTVKLTTTSEVSKLGCVQGTVTLTAANGKVSTASDGDANLWSSKKAWNTTTSGISQYTSNIAKGSYKIIGVPIGTYFLEGQWVDTSTGDTYTYTKNSVTTVAGKCITVNFTMTSEFASKNTGNNVPFCESTGGVFSWFTCGVIDAMQGIDSSVEGAIGGLLKTNTMELNSNCASGDNSCDTYNAWSNFRIYGDTVLVIALLAMIFAEVFGGGIAEAYNLKKMLPRILVAAILINLSVYIVAALEDVVNIFGAGIYDLLSAPFKSAGLAITIKGGQGIAFTVGGTAGLLGILAAAKFWAAAGAGGLGDAVGFLVLMVALPAIVAILGVLLTIFFRQAILVVLVIVSPVAFALWCLPNTEQYFRKWWDFLFKTLLVYPIVMVVFALCDIGAIVMSAMGIGGDWLGELMSIVAVVIPLFLVPFAFKIAGGVTGQIHEAISGLGKRGVEGIKGNPNDPSSLRNRTRDKFNARRSKAGLSGASINDRLGGFIPGKKSYYTKSGRIKVARAIADRRSGELKAAGEKYLESDKIWQAHKEDSKFTMAAANRQLALQRRDAAAHKGTPEGDAEVEQWQQALDSASMLPDNAGVRMAAAQAWLASGYDLDKDGQTAYNEMARTFSDITGAGVQTDTSGNVIGFSGTNAGAAVDAMNTAQSAMARNGQFQLAGINYGRGYDPDLGLSKADPYTWGRSKPGSATGAKDSAIAHIAKGTDDDLKKASVYKQELRSIAQSATGAQRDEALKAYGELNDTVDHSATMTDPAERAKEKARVAAASKLSSWEGAEVIGSSGGPITQRQEKLDLNKNYGGSEAAARAAGWTDADFDRGWREVHRTNRDVAAEQARISRIPREDE